jgi:putative DNA methylase
VKKKLIEVALPLEAINDACKPETENPFLKGHPRALHMYWARIPLVACRAVLFGSLVDDPSGRPDEYPSVEEQDAERDRLFHLLERLARWDATKDDEVWALARAEIAKSTAGDLPALVDPFTGRGSIPIEGQRLGLDVFASDLNPVAVLITKSLVDTPARFAGRGPVHPNAPKRLGPDGFHSTDGLSQDIRLYARNIEVEARSSVGKHFPPVLTGDESLPVTAWLWARTVTCPNPACRATIPLVRSFVLSSKAGKRAWVVPAVADDRRSIRFSTAFGDGHIPASTKASTRGARFRCLVCETVTEEGYVRAEAQAGRMGQQLMAIVAQRQRGRAYVAPSDPHVSAAAEAIPRNPPETDLPTQALGFRVQAYGMTRHRDLFTPRQLLALETLSDLVAATHRQVEADAVAAGMSSDNVPLSNDGTGATAYADAIVTYLSCAVSRLADYANSLATWNDTNQNVRNLFQRQAVPMVWDFAEANIITGSLSIAAAAEWITEALSSLPASSGGHADQLDATIAMPLDRPIALVSTDPPYYDNIGYADLADFFYVWLRRSLQPIYPDLFSTLLTPKVAELVATPYRFGGDSQAAKDHFVRGLEAAFAKMGAIAHRDFPITVYYAFRQEETDGEAGFASTGWETMLEGLIDAGLSVTGTWPMRTTKSARSVARGTNALASAIVLVCRPRPADAALATRKSFISALHAELPPALKTLEQGRIAPVDLAQAAIGPGIGVFSRFSRVVEASGETMTVRAALALINETLDKILSEQEGEFDAETRWAISWYDQFGFGDGSAGDANLLCNAKNTALNALVDAGIVATGGAKVRLLGVEELDGSWDPSLDNRLTIWEIVHHMIRTLESEGEVATSDLLRKLGGIADSALMLTYRLYSICQRRQRARDGLAYNTLATAWPELGRLASRHARPASEQLEL